MNNSFRNVILKSTGSASISEIEEIQSLWSGYGRISRYTLSGSKIKTVVVKHVVLPENKKGHDFAESDISHRRKIKSYMVEAAWYRHWSDECRPFCRIPGCYALEFGGNEFLTVLEDLDAAGYPGRRSRPSPDEIGICIEWLAEFHSIFMNREPVNLWKNGTYWHLDTRPDEYKALRDPELKAAAASIDLKLKKCNFKTILHGDAKLDNFCFSDDGKKVAAVDFQYTGGGCGMKDIAYFIGSCLDESECGAMEDELLDFYFSCLEKSLRKHKPEINFADVEKEWREMYRYAWTDFHRFLKGWTVMTWKPDSYSEIIAGEIIRKLRIEK
ncbi:MAG: phosphotransferase [Spirochaetes bacterium]|nr:phosphotransferase [Spirochaetota bacterium]